MSVEWMYLVLLGLITIIWYLDRIVVLLSRIEKLLMPGEPKLSAEFYMIKNGQEERLRKMEVSGQQEFNVKVKYTDDFENSAEVENLKIGMTDPSLGTVVMNEDGKSAKVKLNGKAGAFQFTADADAKLGEGEVLLHAESEEIVVKPGMATKAVMDIELVTAPVPQPEPEPQPEPQPEPEPAPEPVPEAKKANKKK